MTRRNIVFFLLIPFLFLSVAACGSANGQDDGDGGSDRDHRSDAGSDIGRDGGGDTAPDAAGDSGKDAHSGDDAGGDGGDSDSDSDGDGDVPSPDPNRYHWNGTEDPFFEGWYYKLTEPGTGESFFFIYGVQNPATPAQATSGGFVYVEHSDGDYEFDLLPLGEFQASKKVCNVTIGESHATETHIDGAVGPGSHVITWDLDIDILSEWGNTMGILTNKPLIPVNWYVNALSSRISGTIVWRGKEYVIEDAPGYNDHNWGPIFPASWLWSQANGFDDPDEALAFAGGPVPLGAVTPDGYMLVYRVQGKMFEFRTQDVTALFDVAQSHATGQVKVTATKGNDRVVYTVDTKPADQRVVLAPTTQGMVPGGFETFEGVFTVDLYIKQASGWTLLRHAVSDIGVMEFGGGYGGF